MKNKKNAKTQGRAEQKTNITGQSSRKHRNLV
jgi:hypothetical protein